MSFWKGITIIFANTGVDVASGIGKLRVRSFSCSRIGLSCLPCLRIAERYAAISAVRCVSGIKPLLLQSEATQINGWGMALEEQAMSRFLFRAQWRRWLVVYGLLHQPLHQFAIVPTHRPGCICQKHYC